MESHSAKKTRKTSIICNQIYKIFGYHIKLIKLETEMQLPYVLFYIWKLKEKYDLEVDNNLGGT